jgi:hypothetical protein
VTDAEIIAAAKEIERQKWAAKGYKLEAELEAYLKHGKIPGPR